MHDIWNPWHGCRRKSKGCENCYMFFLDRVRDIFLTISVDKLYECRRKRGTHKIYGYVVVVSVTSSTRKVTRLFQSSPGTWYWTYK